ncbi:MAG: hypothetical protein ACJ76Y_05300, partial [Thermoanaerobaculia bacterium]
QMRESEEGEAELDVLRYATGGRTQVSLEELRRLDPERRLELILARGREAGGLPAGMEASGLRRLVAILEANRRALRAYHPEPADVHAVYIRAAEGVRADAAWEPLALGGLAVHEVAGSHLSMHLPPYVAALGEHLAACIEASKRPASEALKEHGVAMARAT